MPTYNIADPNCPLPDVLILDASILLELRATSQGSIDQRRLVVLAFLQRIRQEVLAGQMMVVADTITLEECYFKIIQHEFFAETKNRAAATGKSPDPWNVLYKKEPNLILAFLPKLEQLRNAVQALLVDILDPADLGSPPPAIEPRMFEHMGQTPILPKDAYLLALSDRLDTPHIATLDSDFQRAGAVFSIYTYTP